MVNIEKIKELNPYIEGYCKIVIEGAHERISYLSKTKEDLVVGALIARMATLSAHLMACPVGWNYYMAAFSFRTQVECFITLGWILKDINENSKRYVAASIRQGRQDAEKYDEILSDLEKENPGFVDVRKEIKKLENEKEQWRQSQQAEWGYSKGMPSIAERARDAGIASKIIYADMYSWLCEHSHNSWSSLYHCNTEEILNSTLRIPVISHGIDTRVMESSAEYLKTAYQIIDEKYNLDIRITSPIQYWKEHALEIKKILSK